MRRAERVLSRGFERRAPWATRFEVGGRARGGGYDPAGDARVEQFGAAFPEARTILELGCLEGGLSFRLARRPGVRVTAVDSRRANVGRARFVQRLLAAEGAPGAGGVVFFHADLEVVRPADLGRYDAVFCQVLHHLPRPWRLVDGLRGAAPAVFLWTHYAAETEAVHGLDGTPGRWYRERDPTAPASGSAPRAFWPTRDALVDRLRDRGYPSVEVLADERDHPNGPAVTLVARA